MTRRAVVVVLAVLVVVLAVALTWTLTRPASQPTGTPITSSTRTPTYNPSAGDAGDPAGDDRASDPALEQEAAWRPVVEHFGQAFTDTRAGARAWRTRIIGERTPAYVTDEVAEQLATVDVDDVPRGRYEAYERLESSAYDVAVRVDYREGWSLVLYLNTDGTSWQVYAYDKYEG